MHCSEEGLQDGVSLKARSGAGRTWRLMVFSYSEKKVATIPCVQNIHPADFQNPLIEFCCWFMTWAVTPVISMACLFTSIDLTHSCAVLILQQQVAGSFGYKQWLSSSFLSLTFSIIMRLSWKELLLLVLKGDLWSYVLAWYRKPIQCQPETLCRIQNAKLAASSRGVKGKAIPTHKLLDDLSLQNVGNAHPISRFPQASCKQFILFRKVSVFLTS